VIEFDGVANPARDDAPAPEVERGYLAEPEIGRGRGVLVLHPWWGLNDAVKQMCDGLAQAGFTVLAPDLYRGAGVASTIEDAERMSDAIDTVRAEQCALGAFDRLRAMVDGAIGVVGFSMGVGYALWLSRKRPDQVGALVLFYGTGGETGAAAPVLGHFAADDPYEPAEVVDDLERQLRGEGRLEALHRYPGVGHWFAEPDRPEFNPDAAQLAWQRTLEFLRARLG
jgi:carboxymethylenebutenolidase